MTPADPFAAIYALEGVGAAAAQARDAIDVLWSHPAMRRDAGAVAAEVAVACAAASAELEGESRAGHDADDAGNAVELPALAGGEPGPLYQGALRVTVELPGLAATWERSPAQALARVHTLAAHGLSGGSALGRPRADVDHDRLAQILELSVAPTSAPGVVVAALVHAELVDLAPFAAANGVVARTVERIVLVSLGVDTRLVCATEVGHAADPSLYRRGLAAYARGGAAGVGGWVRLACEAYARGADATLAICASRVG